MTPRLRDDLNVGDEPIYDTWTWLDFKLATTRTSGRSTHLAPDWMRPHRRRMTAYNILQAIRSNAARRLLDISGRTPEERDQADEDREQHREYGDPDAIIAGIRSALLGESQEIVVDGADDFDPDLAAPGDPGDPNPADSANPTDQPDAPTPEQLAANAEAGLAAAMQDWLRDWATADMFPLKLIETEDNAVALGDGVYSFGYSTSKGRVRGRIWHPSFYFPVLEDDAAEDDYPRRVHMAWEIEDPNDSSKTLIRRITWELGPVGSTEPSQINSWRATGVIPPGTGSYRPAYSDTNTQITCFMTDATFELDTGKTPSVDDLSLASAKFASDSDGEVRMRDLRMDFIPVLHMPNTVALLDHYGRSSIAVIAQVLDDIANADTDLSKASATTGFPPVAIKGGAMGGEASYTPGQVWEIPAGGSMDILDTSGALDALLKYVESLLKRASVNSRVPEEWLGRIVKTADSPSGISRRLSFGPLERMCAEMRLVRDAKYELLLKFVWRIALVNGQKDVPKTFVPARLALGSFMPADLEGVVKSVYSLRSTVPPSISLETAIGLLIEAGMSIDDAVEEIARIEERDFVGANELLNATGDEATVFDYLGRKQPATPTIEPPPTPTLPPGPGAGA